MGEEGRKRVELASYETLLPESREVYTASRLYRGLVCEYIDDFNAETKERGKGGLWNTSYGPTNVTSQAMLDAGVSDVAG